MTTLQTLVLIAVCATTPWASGQPTPNNAAHCPGAADIGPQHLYGTWRAELAGQPDHATLVFEKHPELAGSVRGRVTRAGTSALLAGDVDNGELTLEESWDAEHISANWLGTVVATSCGKEIRGTWNNTSNNTAAPFILRKQPGWQ